MKIYQRVARDLMVVHNAVRWQPRLRRILKAAPLVVVFLLLNSRTARAQCSFNPTPDPTADGSSNSLRQAIQAANASGQDCLIQLQTGTYTLSQGELEITTGSHTVTIQGQSAQASIVKGNRFLGRVFQVQGANAVFANLTITGGLAQDDGTPGEPPSEGGGLLVRDGSNVTLSAVVIEGNTAFGEEGTIGTRNSPNGGPGQAAQGGGLFSAGTVEVKDSTISGNAAIGGTGGGGYGSFELCDLFGFTVGIAGPGGSGAGGGLYVVSGSASVSRSTVSGNNAAGGSGGSPGFCFELFGQKFGLFGLNGGDGQGGGLFTQANALSLSQTTVSGNSATGGDGGTFFGTNPSSGGSSRGAGIFVASGDSSLTNSTLFGNMAKGGSPGECSGLGCGTRLIGGGGNAFGGGLYSNTASVSLAGVTLASNEALTSSVEHANNFTLKVGSGAGGGIYNAGIGPSVNISLIGNNIAEPGGQFQPGPPPPPPSPSDVDGGITASYSLISQTSGATITDLGGNIFDQNPQLAPKGLQPNGGPTLTVALLSGSPAIDVVPVANCTDLGSPPQALTTDQRGMPRPDFGENVCDIGAFESQETFAGQPGAPNCRGVSVSTLSNQYNGELAAAATALHFPSVQALQAAIGAFCGQ